jgi:stage V sporulation protein G
MQITDVRIRKVNDEGKMRAIVSVTFDDEFVVHDIKVIEGQNGLFIAMPSRKMGEGDFRDIAHPLTSETRNRIKEAIFEEYHKVLEAREAEKGQEVTAVETEEKEAEAAQAIIIGTIMVMVCFFILFI